MGERAAKRRPDAADGLPSTRRDTLVEAATPDPATRSAAPRGTEPGSSAPGTSLQRLFWFGALWLAGVATVSLVAFVIRSVIGS